jgi:hypothetical protein
LIYNALKNLENELAAEMNQFARRIEKRGDKAGDVLKTQYLDAKYRYEYVSNTLGPDSPAKVDARLKEQRAAAKAALDQLTEFLPRAKDLQDVMKYVAQASKNTSPLPALLTEARTNDDMKTVLRIIGEPGNEDYARRLARKILASEDATQVGDAFADIYSQTQSAGVQDPEVLLKMKLEALTKKFILQADLRLGEIKSSFIK